MFKRSNSKTKKKGLKDKKPKRFRKRTCKFCGEKTAMIDFKDVNRLSRSVTEKGKIVPRRLSGACARHQRQLSRAIKRGRQMSLIPYTVL